MNADCIVVGSGACGATAATTLVEGGASVLMLDGGRRDDGLGRRIPPKSYAEIRRTEPEQSAYFLGEHFEGAAYRRVGAGAQLTPPRRFIVDGVDELLKVRTTGFAPLESLAVGGLAAGWGLNCAVYSDAELEQASLPVDAMRSAYQVVADRIGIAGAGDDASPYTIDGLTGIQPALPLDPSAAYLYARYERRRREIRALGYRVGHPALALLTHPKGDRGATELFDMEFYSDAGKAAWRPAHALADLHGRAAFSRAGDVLVTRFANASGGGIDVFARDLQNGGEKRYTCRRLVLAAGALGTARIVLRSANSSAKLPLLCNDYTYVPSILPARIGRSMPERTQSLTQLTLIDDPDGAQRDVAVGTIFSYRSLMLFRLLREMPLNVRDARIVMRYLLSGFIIAGFDHPQGRSSRKTLWLEPDASSPTADRLAIDYELTGDERHGHERRERGFTRVLRELGALPLKRVHPPLGSSLHYAGTLPFYRDDAQFTLSPHGRLHGSAAVFVADGSGFTFLSAKPLTLSLMANAHRVARNVLEQRAV